MKRLGPYALEEEIGRGGMGRVFRARHAPTGAVRAVKTFEAGDPETYVRFRREAEALARVGPGVARVHDCGRDGHSVWFAMDLLPGGSLADRLRSGPIPWPEAARVVGRLARTLARCHAIGLVHRDVKPANVLLDEQGEPCLVDFGCVQIASATRLTETGAILGTPGYMAPEQLDGASVDARADVFALGVLLFELILGKAPFEGATVFEGLRSRREGKRPRLAAAVAGVPPALDALLDRALAFAPAARPAEAGAFAIALDEALSGKAPAGVRGTRVVGAVALGAVALGAVALAVGPGIARRGGPSGPGPAEVVPTDPIAGALATLASDAASERAREVALAEVAHAREASVDAALEAAIARARAAPWLRRARIARARRAASPVLSASDVALAAPILARAELDAVLPFASAPARLEGPSRLEAVAAIRSRDPGSTSLALAHALLLLDVGRRDEATLALKVARPGHQAAEVLLSGIDAADRMAHAYVTESFTVRTQLEAAAEKAKVELSRVAAVTTGSRLGTIVAPITACMRRVATARRLEEHRTLGRNASFETALEGVASDLPDEVFATYETARSGLLREETVQGPREVHVRRRVAARLTAALETLTVKDVVLAVEVCMRLIEGEAFYGPQDDPERQRAWIARLERLEAAADRPETRARIAAFECRVEVTEALRLPGPPAPERLRRALDAWTRGLPAWRVLVGNERPVPFAVEGARAHLLAGRPAEAREILRHFGAMAPDLDAEILRRLGDHRGLASWLEQRSELDDWSGGYDPAALEATLALNHAALGEESAGRTRLLAAIGTRSAHDRLLLELTVQDVRDTFESALRASATRPTAEGPR